MSTYVDVHSRGVRAAARRAEPVRAAAHAAAASAGSLCYTTRHLYYTRHFTLLYSTILYFTILYYTVIQYYMIYYTIIHYIVLHIHAICNSRSASVATCTRRGTSRRPPYTM